MLTELSLDTLLDQEFEGRHQAERVQNSEVPYVRCLIGWIAKTFDYINRLKLTLSLSVYKGTWTYSPPLIAMHLLDRSCVIVRIFFKLHATFPNTVPILCYMVRFDQEKIKRKLSGRSAAVSRRNLGRTNLGL